MLHFFLVQTLLETNAFSVSNTGNVGKDVYITYGSPILKENGFFNFFYGHKCKCISVSLFISYKLNCDVENGMSSCESFLEEQEMKFDILDWIFPESYFLLDVCGMEKGSRNFILFIYILITGSDFCISYYAIFSTSLSWVLITFFLFLSP